MPRAILKWQVGACGASIFSLYQVTEGLARFYVSPLVFALTPSGGECFPGSFYPSVCKKPPR